MKQKMMIDYRDEYTDRIIREVIDDFEFCVRDGKGIFDSQGDRREIPLENIIQIYTY